jgi:hypothetical protein
MRVVSTTSIVVGFSTHQAIANGTSVSFGPAFAGAFEFITFVCEPTVNATYNFGFFDGTANRLGAAGVLSAGAQTFMCCVTGMLAVISNSGTASGFYNLTEGTFLT